MSPAASHAVDGVCGAGFQRGDLELDGGGALLRVIMVEPIAQLRVRHAQRRLLLLAELGGCRRQFPDIVVVKRDEPRVRVLGLASQHTNGYVAARAELALGPAFLGRSIPIRGQGRGDNNPGTVALIDAVLPA
jgi:hypothetical protein